MTNRLLTGIIRRPDGAPWPNARLWLRLKSDPALLDSTLHALSEQAIRTESDGSIPAGGLLLATPASGAWLWELQVEKNTAVSALVERGDGSAVTVDGFYTLAGLAGAEAGTPQYEFLVALYGGFADAADGDGPVKSGDSPVWAAGAGGGISDAPSDGSTYARLNAAWSNITTALTNAREWTASTVSQAEAEAGTATARRAWTAERVGQAIAALVSVAWTQLTGTLTLSQLNTAVSDATLDDSSAARTPTAHAASHATGESDEIAPGDIGAMAAADPLLAAYRETVITATVAATYTIDWSVGTIFVLTLTDNTAITMSNVAAGRSITVIYIQDGTGNRIPSYTNAITWPEGGAATLSTAANDRDKIVFDSYNGTVIDGQLAGLAYA
jgi:hypothetical protein